MFLKSLTITEDDQVVREINFRKGVNLIVDETQSSSRTESGNNVGKTTVLRLIDYCLGSKGHNIYQDPEFKNKSNSAIEDYLKSNDVKIILILTEDLSDSTAREIKICRNFLSRKEKIIEVDGEAVAAKDFPECLKDPVFATNVQKPTFRQIISKNIRDEKSRLVNTVRVLHPTTTAQEYEALYLYWLGIELNSSHRKQSLLQKKKIEQNLHQRLRKESTLSQTTQALTVVNNDISELEKKRNSFNINENHESDLEALNSCKSEISRKSTKIARLKLRADLIAESNTELENELSTLDMSRLEKLYSDAKRLVPEIHKTFEQVQQFHNGMIESKKRYISSELPELNQEISHLENELAQSRNKERTYSASLNNSESVQDFQKLVERLNRAHENKGSLEEQKRLWESSLEKLEKIESELAEIDSNIGSLDEAIQNQVTEFNSFFSKLSDNLYGEQYVLSADKDDKGYELNISSIVSNPGTGKKKAEMAAFDLAYIQFADHMDINCLHFILQDQIENIHDNQINSILTGYVESHNCQYVLPVLRDKLPEKIDTSKFEVLSLSQRDKLFRIKP